MSQALRIFPRLLLPDCRFWCESWRADPVAFWMYRRHYSARNRRPKQAKRGMLCQQCDRKNGDEQEAA